MKRIPDLLWCVEKLLPQKKLTVPTEALCVGWRSLVAAFRDREVVIEITLSAIQTLYATCKLPDPI